MSHDVMVHGARYELSQIPLLCAGLALIFALCSLAWIPRKRVGERGIVLVVCTLLLWALALAVAPIVTALGWPLEAEGSVGPALSEVVDLTSLALELGLAVSAMLALLAGLVAGAARPAIEGTRNPGLALAGLAVAALVPLSLQLSVLAVSWHLPGVTAELPAAATGSPARLRAMAMHARGRSLYWATDERIETRRESSGRGTVALWAPFVRIARDVEVVVGRPAGEVELSDGASWTWNCRRSGRRLFGVATGSTESLTVRVAGSHRRHGLTVVEVEAPGTSMLAWSVAGRTFARSADGWIGPWMEEPRFAPLPGFECSSVASGVPLRCTRRHSGSVVPGIVTLLIVTEGDGETTCSLAI